MNISELLGCEKLEAALLNKKFKTLWLLIIYKFVLEVSYVIFVYPLFSYMGFTYDSSIIKFIESYIFLALIIFLMPVDETRPSTIALNIMLLLNVIPIMSIYSLMNKSRLYCYTIVFSFTIMLIINKFMPLLKISKMKSCNIIVYIIIGGISCFVYAGLIYFNGIPSLRMFDFSNVYEYRRGFTYGISILAYLVPWQANIINILLIANFLHKKNYKFLVGVIILHAFLFLLTGSRTMLFQPIVAICMSIFIKKKKLVRLSIQSLILIIILVITFYYATGNVMLASLSIRRTLYVPANISFIYHDYFSNNEYAYLSHSIFESFFDKPVYEIPAAQLLGDLYGRGSWMNTGVFGDAYMNFGLLGVLIFSILLIMILKTIDSLANTSIKKVVSGAVMGLFMWKLVNTALFTSLLTGGLLFFMLVLWFYQDDHYNEIN